MSDPIDDALTALTRYFVGDETMGQTLERVCDAAIRAVPPASFCGISIVVDGKLGTYIFSHPEVPQIDRAQYDTGEGPCVDAYRTGRRVLVRSTSEPGPYPEFRAMARGYGLHSVLSTPMTTNSDLLGAMNLYADQDNAFSDSDIRTADAFATQAAFLLANSKAYWDAHMLSENLSQAMASRAEIEQAKGIIMAHTGVDADEAFAQLRAPSPNTRTSSFETSPARSSHAQRDPAGSKSAPDPYAPPRAFCRAQSAKSGPVAPSRRN
jgi:GAF domain-containing protein